METPQDSFRRKNNFMNGKTQNMATSAASDKNTDQEGWKKNKKPREKKYKSADWLRAESLILEQLWLAQRPQLKRGLLQVTDTKNFHVHVGVDDYEAMPFWA